ncbi:MAG TPA: PstS family phosphate ABC transporter substrate-binding protein, partial [Opitutaceae bacterium]
IAVLWSGTSLALASLFSGCSGEPHAPPGSLSGALAIKGSNTFGEELAPRLIEEYRKNQRNVILSLESRGSNSGAAALLAGECDIAALSRKLSAEEMDKAREAGLEINQYVIGYYGVAVIVPESNPVERLMPEQVSGIFTGQVRNWQTVGGPDLPIRVMIRDPLSGTHLGFRELAMANQPYVSDAKLFKTYAELVEAIAAEPGAVGYSSMNLAKLHGLRAVPIGKYEPTALVVNEGWYPYARTLRLLTNKARESEASRDFVRFVQGRDGQTVIEDLGFVRRFEKRLDSYLPD